VEHIRFIQYVHDKNVKLAVNLTRLDLATFYQLVTLNCPLGYQTGNDVANRLGDLLLNSG
jgi:hypothetical protein